MAHKNQVLFEEPATVFVGDVQMYMLLSKFYGRLGFGGRFTVYRDKIALRQSFSRKEVTLPKSDIEEIVPYRNPLFSGGAGRIRINHHNPTVKSFVVFFASAEALGVLQSAGYPVKTD